MIFLFITSLAFIFAVFAVIRRLRFAHDKSDDDGYDSGFSGTYSFTTFSLRFENSVGRVSGLGSGVFVPTGVESKCDIFAFVVFVPI